MLSHPDGRILMRYFILVFLMYPAVKERVRNRHVLEEGYKIY